MTRPNDATLTVNRSMRPASVDGITPDARAKQIEEELSRAQSEVTAAIASYQHIGDRLIETQRAIRNAQIAANTNHVIKSADRAAGPDALEPVDPAKRAINELVSLDRVLIELGISTSVLARLRKADGFPDGFRISHNRTAFDRLEINAWLHGRRIKPSGLVGKYGPSPVDSPRAADPNSAGPGKRAAE